MKNRMLDLWVNGDRVFLMFPNPVDYETAISAAIELYKEGRIPDVFQEVPIPQDNGRLWIFKVCRLQDAVDEGGDT
ncbi:MAG: hypothetical protein QW453_06300 [Thermoprotei archaeon]